MIKLEKERFKDLEIADLSKFDDGEKQNLLKMGIILFEHINEFQFVKQSREKFFTKKENKEFKCTILTTTDCNARCYYCYEQGTEKITMNMDTAQKTIDYIKKHRKGKPVHLKWFGGEPLCNAEIIDFISAEIKAADIDFQSSLITNGYLFNEELIKKAIDVWQLTHVQITLDGIDEEYNNVKNYKKNNGESSFKKVISNIAILLANNIKVVIRINFNASEISDAFKAIDYLYNKFGNIPNLIVYCSNISGSDIVYPLDYPSDKNPFLKLYEKLILCGYINSLNEMGLNPKILNCSIYNKDAVVINANGNLHKCQHAIIMDNNDAFGSLGQEKIKKNKIVFWENLEYPYYDCEKCKCLPVCQGGCKYHTTYDYKDLICLPIKNCLHQVLRIFYEKIYTRR